jgi:ribosomal protein S18 acetylase RimI-like enzyme
MDSDARVFTSEMLDGLAAKAKYYVVRFAAKERSGASVRDEAGGALALVHSGIASDTFNCAVLRALDPRVTRADIERACARFNGDRMPAAFWTCDGLRDGDVELALAQHHFVEDEQNIGMVVELTAQSWDEPATAIELRQASQVADILEFGRALASLTEPPDAAMLAFYAAVGSLEPAPSREDALQLFAGRHEGECVCTASVFFQNDGAHIYDLSTSSSARGRGLGSAMMTHVLRYARDRGAKRAFLLASAAGLGVYRRLGFDEVCTARVYSNKHYLEHGDSA